MYEANQFEIPPSFVALFVDPGQTRPHAPREAVAERYELCEDLAQMLTETAPTLMFQLGVSESDALERCLGGLQAEGSVVSPAEAAWVVRRLAELLNWEPLP